jgi:hypothetical protein
MSLIPDARLERRISACLPTDKLTHHAELLAVVNAREGWAKWTMPELLRALDDMLDCGQLTHRRIGNTGQWGWQMNSLWAQRCFTAVPVGPTHEVRA